MSSKLPENVRVVDFKKESKTECLPLKQWKLSPIDMASMDKWDDYTRAKEEMFFHTDTADSPWTVVRSDDKKRARINCMRYVLTQLNYAEKDEKQVGKLDTRIIGDAKAIYEKDERSLLIAGAKDAPLGAPKKVA